MIRALTNQLAQVKSMPLQGSSIQMASTHRAHLNHSGDHVSFRGNTSQDLQTQFSVPASNPETAPETFLLQLVAQAVSNPNLKAGYANQQETVDLSRTNVKPVGFELPEGARNILYYPLPGNRSVSPTSVTLADGRSIKLASSMSANGFDIDIKGPFLIIESADARSISLIKLPNEQASEANQSFAGKVSRLLALTLRRPEPGSFWEEFERDVVEKQGIQVVAQELKPDFDRLGIQFPA